VANVPLKRSIARGAFCQRVHGPVGRDRLPHRSTLRRNLPAFDQATVEALRALFLKELRARPQGTFGESRRTLGSRGDPLVGLQCE